MKKSNDYLSGDYRADIIRMVSGTDNFALLESIYWFTMTSLSMQDAAQHERQKEALSKRRA